MHKLKIQNVINLFIPNYQEFVLQMSRTTNLYVSSHIYVADNPELATQTQILYKKFPVQT
jgi:hypothetical protein